MVELPTMPTVAPDESAAAPLVELRGIVRRYPNGTVALGGVDLQIDAGEGVAVIGRSGSGKSTLLNVLGLLDAPTDGEVIIDGEPVQAASDRMRSERRSRDLGFVFQRSHLIGAQSVLDNVLLGLRYSAAPERRARAAAIEALRAVGMDHRVDARAQTLSGGEMQRVAIARTMARPVRLWLADEPTGNLDSEQSAEIIELLKVRAAQRGAALVVVTHEPDIAARLDRVITLNDGHVVSDTGRTSARPSVGESHGGAAVATSAGRIAPAHPRTTRRRRLGRSARFLVQGLAAHPGRARAGVAASAIAVALAVAALGLAQSAAAQVNSLFDAQRATQVSAQLVTDTYSPPRWPLRLEALQAFPGVDDIEVWWHRTGVPMSNANLAAQAVDLVQVDAAPGATTDSVITWGAADDAALADGEVLLGAVLAQRLGISQIDLSPEVTVQGVRLRVAGILESSRSGTATGSAFVTANTASSLPAPLSAELFIQTQPGAARGIADRLQALVDPYETMRISIDPVLEADAYRGQLQDSVAASLQVLAVVASLAGLIAVVFVNILGVGSRTAEFGVRRAFGASRTELVALVVGEGVVLAVIGAVIGLATGFVSIMAVTAVAHWQPVFDPQLLLIPLAGALAFGTLGGLPPAVTAGRIEPADAVRT